MATLMLTAILAPAASSDAQVAADRAARGLDVFLHVPLEAAPGSLLPVQVEAFGFPTAVTLAPMPDATIEVGWDPEHLGPGIAAAPPTVRAHADARGRATLLVPVPDGDPRQLHLVVVARVGSHERSRWAPVTRGSMHTVSVYVADDQVVPGSSISTWVAVANASSGQPAAGARVQLELLEGGVPRTSIPLTTDSAGTAMARVAIPYIEEPDWRWTLRAQSMTAGARVTGEADVTLRPREETPATPTMRASFDDETVRAGDRAAFTVRVHDASGRPVAALPLRYWVGPRGTNPPSDDEAWEKIAKRGATGLDGELHGTFDAPTLVVRSVGSTLRLVVRGAVDGHALSGDASVSVGLPTSTAELLPEAGSVVPGAPQRLLLRVADGHGLPVAASFAVTADGLDARVTTNADGEGQLTWQPPAELGALRNVGPCAGGVAAAVVVRPIGNVPALAARKEPFELCLQVDRDRHGMVSVDRSLARMGEKIHVRVVEREAAKGKDAEARSYSLVLRAPKSEQATSVWVDDGDKGVDVVIPDGAPGVWSITAASPSASRAATVTAGALTVLPRVLPKLVATVVGGRAAPRGAVEVDAELGDGKAAGIQGTVAALVVDLHGGGSTWGVEEIDARRSICRKLGVAYDRCDRFVDGDPSLDPLRRALAGVHIGSPLTPEQDPGGTAREELNKTFGAVLHSLEGALFEASASADRMSDVRRRNGRSSTFNPELMTLVTAAMGATPETPGGEPISLADLLAVDPQVTFDNVARRITRLKLFYVLDKVRTYKRERQTDPDEPMLKDPNAILRRLVRSGTVTEDMLVDPWGGTIQFVPAQGAPIPFITVARGFELRSPGPDRRAGTGDDVRDPFERVVRSGTPYANAMGEDRIVDARYDMEVADTTVSAWQSLLEEHTGRTLGDTFGAGGIGTSGYGSGHGRLGGSHVRMGATMRGSSGLTTGVAWWSAPERTDAHGHVRFHVPLGDEETTWRIVLVGVPDGAPRATTWVDVPVALPLSARVDTGVTWVEGDRAQVLVTLHNRTSSAVHATVRASVSGAARLDPGIASLERGVDIAAGGMATTPIPVVSGSPGPAELAVTVNAPGLPEDVVKHGWLVLHAGEPMDLTRAQWVTGEATVDAAFGDRRLVDTDSGPLPVRLVGTPRLVLERGIDRPLRAALDAMDPDNLASRDAFIDAVEVASRIQRWAIAKEGEASPLAAHAADILSRARGRFAGYGHAPADLGWALDTRLKAFAPSQRRPNDKPTCPVGVPASNTLLALEAEPTAEGGTALACWDAFVTTTVEEVTSGGSAVGLARVYLALAERPQRASLAATLIDRLREKVAMRPSGAIALSDTEAKDRASRAIVYAALLRGARAGKPSVATPERLVAWIGVQRDADGGYGSPLATREVVRALLDAGIDEQGTSRVTVVAGKLRREIEVAASARVEVALDPTTVSVKLDVTGPGLVARLERPVVRLWSPASTSPVAATGLDSPLHLDVTWPADAHAGTKGTVSVAVRHSRARATLVKVRVPLPPGASLAEPVKGVQQIQGALMIRRLLDASELVTQIDLPIRFGLAGRFTVPEARATVAYEDVPRALAPARPLVVQ